MINDKLTEGISSVFSSSKMNDAENKSEALKRLKDVIDVSTKINLLMMGMASDMHVMVLHSPTFKKHLELMDKQIEAIHNLRETIERL